MGPEKKDNNKAMTLSHSPLPFSPNSKLLGRRHDITKPGNSKIGRPTFSEPAKMMARTQGAHSYPGLALDADHAKENMAMPHRMSWKDIRDNTVHDMHHKDTAGFMRWTNRFIEAGKEVLQMPGRNTKQRHDNQERFVTARNDLVSGKAASADEFFKAANTFHANVPDIGPHKGVNNVVGERAHLNVIPDQHGRRSLSPMSRRVASMSPHRLSGLPVDQHGHLIDVRGNTHDAGAATWNKRDLDNLTRHATVTISGFKPPKSS